MGMGNIRNRHAAGTPLGGRFAPGQSAEPVGATTLAEPLDPLEQALLDGGWQMIDAQGDRRAFASAAERSCDRIGDLEFGYAQEVTVACLHVDDDGLNNFRMLRFVCAVVPDDPDLDIDDPDERPPSEALILDGKVETWLSDTPGRTAPDGDYELESAEIDGFAGPGDVRNRPNPFKGLTWNDESGIEAAATEAARTYAEVWGRDEAYAQAMAVS